MADDLNVVTDEDEEVSESSEALIAVHWRDEGYYPVKKTLNKIKRLKNTTLLYKK